MSKVPFLKTNILEVNDKSTFKKYGIINEGPSRLMGQVTVSSKLNISGDTIFESNVIAKKSLTVEGLFIAANPVNSTNAGIATDNLIVSRTSTLNSTVTAVSTLNVSGNTTLLGAVTAVSTLNVSGNTTLLNAMTSMSTVNIKGNITATSNINISGNTTVEGYIYGNSLDNLTAGGTLNIGSSNASIINLGNGSGIQTVNIGTNGGGITTINIGGTGDFVNIAGSVNNIISTDLQVTDKLIALNKDSVGSGTARGSGFQIRDSNDNNKAFFIVNASGTGYKLKPPEDVREINFETKNFVDGLLKISGNTIFGSSIADTEMTFNPNVTMMSNLNVSGRTTLFSAITAVSTLNISGNSILQGPTTALSTLNVSGKTTLLGAATVVSTLNVSGNSTLLGPVTMVSSLNISGNTIMTGIVTAKTSMTVEGTVYANDISISSDVKLKNNIKPLTNSLDNVMNLEGVSYYLNGDTKQKIGFIAQDVEKIYPEFVLNNGDIKSVTYPNITAVLVEAIKELNNKYNSLELKYKNLLNNI